MEIKNNPYEQIQPGLAETPLAAMPKKYFGLVPVVVACTVLVMAFSLYFGLKKTNTVQLANSNKKANHSNHAATPAAKQAQTANTSTTPPAVPSTSSSPQPAVSAPPPSTPPSITLTNQDNGRTITPAVGTILNIQLSQLPNGAGYHWLRLAESTSTKQLASVGIPNTRGSDGSTADTNKIAASGNFVLGYADNPNCYPGCNQEQPLELWQVHIDVP
jgi:hypothetical protein